MDFDATVPSLPTRHQVESVALVGAAVIAAGSALRPYWHFVDAYPASFFLVSDWAVVWFGQIAAIELVAIVALLSVITHRRTRPVLRVATAFAVGVVFVELSLVHEQISETNASHRGWAAPGTGSRWLMVAALLLLVPHLRRATLDAVRPWLDRWR